MEVSVLSIETVKPSTLHPKTQPLELNLLDQLTPMSYSPLILFYQNSHQLGQIDVSTRLKSSLSQALSVYYPLAGRVSDNFTIHDFDKGVPFIETRVNGRLFDFLNGADQSSLMGSLNNLLPFKTFCSAPETGPQCGFQVNMFECGGLALGLCSSHKSHDGITVSAFLNVWAAISANRPDKIVPPEFEGGPLTFPLAKPMPRQYESLAKGVWFENGGKPVTRRFMFVGESVAKLRASARSETIERPTRAEAVSAFIWKFIIHSSKSQNHSVLTQSVDLRRLVKQPPLSSQSFGNLVLFSNAKYTGPHPDQSIQIDHLASLIRTGVKELVSADYVSRGSKAIFEYYDRQAEIEDENTDVINLSCWHGFGFSRTDFGWGPPVWVGLGGATTDHSTTSSYCSNSIVLIESGSDGIEAWVTLEEGVMTGLESDPDFLLFAATNFPILRVPMHDMHAKL